MTNSRRDMIGRLIVLDIAIVAFMFEPLLGLLFVNAYGIFEIIRDDAG